MTTGSSRGVTRVAVGALLVGVLAVASWLLVAPAPTTLRLSLRMDAPVVIALQLACGESRPPWREERELPASAELVDVDFTLPPRFITAAQLEIPAGASVLLSRFAVLDGESILEETRARAVGKRGGVDHVREADGLTIRATATESGHAVIRVAFPLLPRSPALRSLQLFMLFVALLVGWLAASVWRAGRVAVPWASVQRLTSVRCIAGAIALLVLGAVVAMAAVSGHLAHPDEWGHAAAAGFHVSHWLPVPIGDPSLDDTLIPRWGRSYLFELDVVYAIAGRFLALLAEPSEAALRAFQVALLALLLVLAAWRAPRQPALLLLLIASPQVWYVYCYFNGDGLPLALSLLAAALVVSIGDAAASGGRAIGRIRWSALAVVLGLLACSKANYRIFVPFCLAALALGLRARVAREEWPRLLRAVVKVAAIPALCFGVRWLYVESINGFDYARRVEAFVETRADPWLTRSGAIAGVGHPGRYLRDRGVPLSELFERPDWVRPMVETATGTYGQIGHVAQPAYYDLAVLLITLLLVLGFVHSWRTAARAERPLLLLTALMIVATVAQAIWHAWTYFMPPQGRYLFPMLATLTIGLDAGLQRIPARVLAVVAVVLAGLAAWSFWFVGLAQIARSPA